MRPSELGQKYDKIAQWWHERHKESSYGVAQFERAVKYGQNGKKALDVGCGAGGRFVRILENNGFSMTGLDVSEKMVQLAQANHPEHCFLQQDICLWETDETFDFIVAWDSLFHLPLNMQTPVISKLCQMLNTNGVFLYTFGDATGEHTDQWHNDTFYYSSIGVNENIQLLIKQGLSISHLELDQYPENHVYVIATKREKTRRA